MSYTIDFLAVENEDSDSTKSGDAIAMKFLVPGEARHRIVIIDSGYSLTGQQMVDHIKSYYSATHVDLVISTHPDVDHINGLKTILEQLSVGELMMHLPWDHRTDAYKISNYEAIVDLYQLATSKNIPVTEPFTGQERFSSTIRILGPNRVRYESLLDQMISEAVSGTEQARFSALRGSGVIVKATRVLDKVLAAFPFETLGDDDDASPRNQSSVITLLEIDGGRKLFTGDAGIESLNQALDYYEGAVGPIVTKPINFFQAPHHGSKHNLGKTVLNRLFGEPAAPRGTFTSYISSAKASEKHPSPKVSNAIGRRGGTVFATEGNGLCHGDWTGRNWTTATPLGPLEEDDEA
jgi:beta-lactamase superfamily II metal-dependent hydrolase